MAKKERRTYQIRSVCKALTLLEQFHGEVCELRPVDLIRLLKGGNNNVLRLLKTLESHDFVEKNRHTGGYSLGLATLGLSHTCIKNKRLVAEGRKALEQLSAATRETVFVAVLRDQSAIYADAVESTLPVRVVVTPGASLPLHNTAAGKLLLAHVGKAGQHLEAEGFRQDGERGIDSVVPLKRQMEEIRKAGYAIDLEEYESGLCGVAAPIRDHSSRVIAAVSIAGPSLRLDAGRLVDEIAPLVMRAGLEISLRMGYQEPIKQEMSLHKVEERELLSKLRHKKLAEREGTPQKLSTCRKKCDVSNIVQMTQVVSGFNII